MNETDLKALDETERKELVEELQTDLKHAKRQLIHNKAKLAGIKQALLILDPP